MAGLKAEMVFLNLQKSRALPFEVYELDNYLFYKAIMSSGAYIGILFTLGQT